MDPKAWREGRDPQLERAVEVAMAALQKNPPKQTKRPAYPNYHNGSSRPETSGGGRSSNHTP
jgi:hypothetical protein